MRKPRRNSPPWYQPPPSSPTPLPQPLSPYAPSTLALGEPPPSPGSSNRFTNTRISHRNSSLFQPDSSPPMPLPQPLSPYATSFVPTRSPSLAGSNDHGRLVEKASIRNLRELAMPSAWRTVTSFAAPPSDLPSRAPSPERESFKALSRTPIPGPITPTSSKLSINGVYNFEDFTVTFEVQGTLYRVHKYFFRRESPELAKKFDSYAEGQAIPLDDVSCADFDALLEFMYSAMFEPEPITLEKWISILHVSNMWHMAKIKAKAIKNINALEGLSPVDKIVLAAREDVDAWFLPAYSSLIERDEPLSVSEARKLFSLGERQVGSVVGMDICPLLAQARERLRASRNRHVESVEGIVREVFGPVTTPASSESLSRL